MRSVADVLSLQNKGRPDSHQISAMGLADELLPQTLCRGMPNVPMWQR